MNRRFQVLLFLVTVFGCQGEPTPTVTDTPTVAEQSTAAPAASPASPISADASPQAVEVSDDQYVAFPGAGVKMIRPDGFEDAENFHGFQQPTTQSAVMAVIIPAPLSELAPAFNETKMKTQGMTLVSKEAIRIDERDGVLITATQTAQGFEFGKFLLMIGDGGKTMMVTATYSRSEEAALSAPLKAVLLSTKVDDSPAPPPGSEVGFTMFASPKLKINPGVGKTLIYTKDGVIPVKSPEDPLLVAAPSLSKTSTGDLRQFAERRLTQTAGTKIGQINSGGELTVDGMNGYEILADGVDIKSSTSIKVYLVVLVDDGSYILIQGLVGANLAEEYLPEFQAMARSLNRTQK